MARRQRKYAEEWYRETLFEAELEGEEYVRATMRDLGRRDLYYLLTRLLNRIDAMDDWLFDRCEEVRLDPNGMLDLWAREHYKSTIITFALSIMDILDSHSPDPLRWDREVTIGIFSHTRPIAKAFLRQIKNEFEINQLLKDLYPDILYQNPRAEAPLWSLDDGITVKRKGNAKEATVEAHGLVDGQPTSKHFLILNYDDVVTLDSVTTPEMMKKVTNAWELSTNLGVDDGGVQRYIGTRYHNNDTWGVMLRRDVAVPRVYPATDTGEVDGEPVFLTKKQLAKKRKDQGPYTFACQMLQNPKADEVQGFDEEWIEYWQPENWGDMNIYIVCDPASGKKREQNKNDYTSMWVVGLAEDGNRYVIDGVRDRLNLVERSDKLFELHRKYRPISVGYEEYGLQADIDHFEFIMTKVNYRFVITPLGGRQSKSNRIKWLVPPFAAHTFYLPHRLAYVDREKRTQNLTTYLVEDELLAFPVSQYDDGMDGLSRIMDPELGAEFPEPTDADLPVSKKVTLAEMNYNRYGRAAGQTTVATTEYDRFRR